MQGKYYLSENKYVSKSIMDYFILCEYNYIVNIVIFKMPI